MRKKTAKNEEKRVFIRKENIPCHKSLETMAVSLWIAFQAPSPPEPKFGPSDYWISPELKKMLLKKSLMNKKDFYQNIEFLLLSIGTGSY